MNLKESLSQIILHLKEIKEICDKCPTYDENCKCEVLFISMFHPAEDINEVIEKLTKERDEEVCV